MRLDALVEEATVDCSNESEQATGLFTMLEEHLALPFKTSVLGVEVKVVGVDITEDDCIVAICDNRPDDCELVRVTERTT